MANDPPAFYPNSLGSITGFSHAQIPTNNPNLAVTGWSIEQLRAFLLNQSDTNFPSDTWLLRVEQMIRDHMSDNDNPHRTSLSQIVADFVEGVLAKVTPGSPPDAPPFYAMDAVVELPFGTVFPATFTSTNLYRRNSAGQLVDPTTSYGTMACDYVAGRAGIPLFSPMANIVLPNWHSVGSAALNTTLSDSTQIQDNYPFTLYDVTESPTTGLFGVEIAMVQDLSTTYTTSFFIKPSNQGGVLRVYQPSDPDNYVEVNLETGDVDSVSEDLVGLAAIDGDGLFWISVRYLSNNPSPDNALRVVHLNDATELSPVRDGSLGRLIFSIGNPQTTRGPLNQPVLRASGETASTSPIALQLNKVSAPPTIDSLTISMSLSIYPEATTTSIPYTDILSFGPLKITRDQTTVRVQVSGNTVFTSTILPGTNTFTLSYSRTSLIFRSLGESSQTSSGSYPSLPTTAVSVGPCGGYLHRLSLYAKAYPNRVVEYLTDA